MIIDYFLLIINGSSVELKIPGNDMALYSNIREKLKEENTCKKVLYSVSRRALPIQSRVMSNALHCRSMLFLIFVVRQ